MRAGQQLIELCLDPIELFFDLIEINGIIKHRKLFGNPNKPENCGEGKQTQSNPQHPQIRLKIAEKRNHGAKNSTRTGVHVAMKSTELLGATPGT